jgi:hypothetical protein
MTIVSKSIDEISPMSQERAKEIETMPDKDIDYSDIPPLEEEFFKKAKRVSKMPTKNKDLLSKRSF